MRADARRAPGVRAHVCEHSPAPGRQPRRRGAVSTHARELAPHASWDNARFVISGGAARVEEKSSGPLGPTRRACTALRRRLHAGTWGIAGPQRPSTGGNEAPEAAEGQCRHARAPPPVCRGTTPASSLQDAQCALKTILQGLQALHVGCRQLTVGELPAGLGSWSSCASRTAGGQPLGACHGRGSRRARSSTAPHVSRHNARFIISGCTVRVENNSTGPLGPTRRACTALRRRPHAVTWGITGPQRPRRRERGPGVRRGAVDARTLEHCPSCILGQRPLHHFRMRSAR